MCFGTVLENRNMKNSTQYLQHSARQMIETSFNETDTTKQYHKVVDKETGKETEFRLRISRHSRKRAQQRGIRPEEISIAMTYGEWVQKQGMCYIIVLDKYLPDHIDTSIRERLHNLVILTNGKTNCMITCYKNAHARRNIKKKSKRLYREAG